MHENSESIYGCSIVDAPQPEWGRLTGKDGVIYAHFFDKSGYCMNVAGVKADDVDYAIFVEDYAECKINQFWNSGARTGNVLVPFGKATLKNDLDTVVKLVLKK